MSPDATESHQIFIILGGRPFPPPPPHTHTHTHTFARDGLCTLHPVWRSVPCLCPQPSPSPTLPIFMQATPLLTYGTLMIDFFNPSPRNNGF